MKTMTMITKMKTMIMNMRMKTTITITRMKTTIMKRAKSITMTMSTWRTWCAQSW